MASNGGVIRRWLKARLISDATLAGLAPGRVWEGVAPLGTQTPYVVFTAVEAGIPYRVIAQPTVFDQALYQVTAWMRGNDYTVLEPIVARIDVLLDRQDGAVTGGTLISCVRVGTVEPPATEDPADPKRMTRQAGYEYRIQVRAA